MAKLRLMSNNQWKCDVNKPAWIERGEDCSAECREKGFARVYTETAPDVVGLQEISGHMTECLMRNLFDCGCRYAMLWGGDTPVLYRADRLEAVDVFHLLYPENCPGLEGVFNNTNTKSYTAAVFRVKENGKLLIFMTTHLWWKSSNPKSKFYAAGSDEARTYQISLAVQKLDELQKKYDAPAILVGDFNAFSDSPAVHYALDHGFTDAHDLAVEYADNTCGYHWCGNDGYQPYVPGNFAQALDHILVRGSDAGLVRRFNRYTPEYYLPLSDHSPLWIDIDI